MTESADKPFDFWNDHCLEFLEMAMKRDYQESVQAPDGYGKNVRDCGDAIEFYLMIKNEKLISISYDIQGCLFSHACANTIIKLALNTTIGQARTIRPEDIVDYLKTLPVNEIHCAVHALEAFTSALNSIEG
ncbi:MAG: iron-sulfur cluster assembly scaffold protein [Desulfobacteraceae bacterium]|nr:iron-sulfur cluster assembly scaffold protein [Desulfobacteraceae bacterium]